MIKLFNYIIFIEYNYIYIYIKISCKFLPAGSHKIRFMRKNPVNWISGDPDGTDSWSAPCHWGVNLDLNHSVIYEEYNYNMSDGSIHAVLTSTCSHPVLTPFSTATSQ